MSKTSLFVSVLTFLLLAQLGWAQETGLTPEGLAQMKSVRSAATSPDGKFAAYTVSSPRLLGKEENGSAWNHLYVADLDTAQSRPYVTGPISVSSIDWVPESPEISFLAKREGDDFVSLWTIPVSGGEAKRRVAFGSNLISYSWSPDGKKVAFVATEPDDPEEKKLKDLGFNQKVYEEDYKTRNLYVAGLDSTVEMEKIPLEGSVWLLDWSPAGNDLLVTLSPKPLTDQEYMQQSLRVVDAESGQIISSVDPRAKLEKIEWSPDGRSFAVLAGEDMHDPAAGRVFWASRDGGELMGPINGRSGHAEDIDWRDRGIYFINAEGVWKALELFDTELGQSTRLFGPGSPIIESLSISEDGESVVFVGSSAKHPSELFQWNKETGKVTRLTDSNPWLSDVALAPQEVIRHRSRDGLELEGILIRPLNEEPGRRYPLILTVHGGPEAHQSSGWLTTYSRLGQVAAARGFAVFYPNYRGSTGRGVDFSKTSQADPAGKEFDDLVDAVDHLISIGLVDPDRVGVTGGSYGGYATAWCSTQYSDRFAAGVMFVGISNKISKLGTTDIPEEEYLVHARMRPWENWNFYLERSPVFHAEKSKTPLLILHGEDDPRVNVGQSREMYRYLKLRGSAPVRLVLYPGEEHGNRKGAARYDYSLRALRWFEHYLNGPGGEPPVYGLDYPVLEGESE